MNPKDPFGLVGQVLDGQFRVDSMVGEGGFSVVYRGHHQGLNEPIAVKCLKLPAALGTSLVDSFVQRFRDESRILYRLSQGNLHIVRSIAAGTTQAPIMNALVPFMVLEWLEGRSLQTEFAARQRGDGRSLPEVLKQFESAADGLAYAHAQGVIHRDLNPGNLFLVEGPRGTSMKVLDFGVAKIMHDGPLKLGPRAHTVGQIRIFAPAYGAPEQFDDRLGPASAATDVYSFALILLEAMQGKAVNEAAHLGAFAQLAVDPTRRPTPRMLGLQVDDEVETAFQRATLLDPGARWQSVGDFWQSLTNGVKVATERKYEKAAQETPSLSEKPESSEAPARKSHGAMGRTMPLAQPGFASPFAPRPGSIPPGTIKSGSGSVTPPPGSIAATAAATERREASARAGKQTMMLAGGPPRMGAAPSPPSAPTPPRPSAFPPPATTEPEAPPTASTNELPTRENVELPTRENANEQPTDRPPSSAASTVDRPFPVGAFASEAEDDEEATRVQLHPTDHERNAKGTSIGLGAMPMQGALAPIPAGAGPSADEPPTEIRPPLDAPPMASPHPALASTFAMNPQPGVTHTAAVGAVQAPGTPFNYGADPRISQMQGSPPFAPAPQPFNVAGGHPDAAHAPPPYGGGPAYPDASHTPPPYGASGAYPDASHTPPPFGGAYPDASHTPPPFGAAYPDPSAPPPHVSQPYGGYPATASGQYGALGGGPTASGQYHALGAAPAGPYPGGSSQLYAQPPAHVPQGYPPTMSGGYPALGGGITPPPPGVDATGGFRPDPSAGMQPGFGGAPMSGHAAPGAVASSKKFPVVPVAIGVLALLAIGGGLFAFAARKNAAEDGAKPETSAMGEDTAPPVATPVPVPVETTPPAVVTAPPAAVDTGEPAPTNEEPPKDEPAANDTPAPTATATAKPVTTATAAPTQAPATTATAVPAHGATAKPAADPNAWNEANARKSLANANGVLIICKKGTASGPGSARVTFANDGTVSAVVLDPPYAGTKEGDCATGQFRRAKVSPFSGGPQTVKHTFDIPK